MKTFNQHQFSENIISLDEIIFEGRNQEYGSFALRKTADKRIIQSFLMIFLIVAPLFLLKFFNKPTEETNKPKEFIFPPISSEKVDKNTFVPPPPPSLPDNIQRELKQNVNSVPEVVDTITEQRFSELTFEPVIPEKPGNVPPPNYEYIDFGDPEGSEASNKKPFIKVEEEAIFRGGTIKDFCIWVGQNVKYPSEAIEMDLHGKVTIQFVVNTEGKTEDIKVLKGIDKLLDAEVVRVIASSPKWRPARQQGTDVKQLFVIPISFQLQNR